VLSLLGYAWLSATNKPGQPPSGVEAEAFRPQFALADANGKIRNQSEFAGRHMLVFFGFTNCPDVCPATLAEVASVLDGLGDAASRVQPIFISIDPERDRTLGLAEFTSAFHPAILGLAGDATSTRAAAASFKVFYEREVEAGAGAVSSPGSVAEEEYGMSHSTALYLIDPDGNWVRSYAYRTPASEILADLNERLVR
jgi:protein SCO1/2